MSKITSVKELHRLWAERIMPADAPRVQRQEMERAFYSGAGALVKLLIEEICTLSDKDAEAALSSTHTEISDYFKLLSKIPGPQGAERQ